MKKLNITKEQFEKSKYFKDKYGRLEYVSESGDVYKTDKGKVLMFKEYGKKVYPAANGCTINDMGDCLIVTNKDGLNIGQCRTMIEAEVIADEAEERTKRKLGLESSKKFGRKFNESDLMNDDEEGEPVIDYQVKFVHVVLFAEYLSRPLKINVHLKGGRCTGASVQKADAQYNSDPWISWLPGKKLKTGGEFYGPTGLFDLAEDRKFKNWLEELVRDIESKYA